MKKEMKDILKSLEFKKDETFVLRKDSFTITVRTIDQDGQEIVEASLFNGHDGRMILKSTGSDLETAFDNLRMAFTDLVDEYRNIDDNLGDFIDEFDNVLGR